MIFETTMKEKRVLYGNKCYRLTYRLVTDENGQYGLEAVCCDNVVCERETVFPGLTRSETLELLRLCWEESVFPVVLSETVENYL